MVIILIVLLFPAYVSSFKQNHIFPVLPSSCVYQNYEQEILDNEAIDMLNRALKSWREANNSCKIYKISSKLPQFVVSGDSGTYVAADPDSYIKEVDDDSFFLVTEKFKSRFDRNLVMCNVSFFKKFQKIWEMDVLKHAQISNNVNLIVISSKLFYFGAKVDEDYLLFVCSLENGKVVKILKNYSHIRRINDHLALLLWRPNSYVISLETFEIQYELPSAYNTVYSKSNRIVVTLPNANGNIEDYPKVLIYDADTGKIIQELNVSATTFEKLGKNPYLISFQGIVGNIIFGMTNFAGEKNRYVFGYDLVLNRLVFAKDTGCLRELLASCDEKYIYYRVNAGIVCLNPENGDTVWTREMPPLFSKINARNDQLILDKSFFGADGNPKEGCYILKNNTWNLTLQANYNERVFLNANSKKGSFYLTDFGMLHFSTTQKTQIELYDLDSSEKKLTIKLPTWGNSSKADFSVFGDMMFVNIDGTGFYEINLKNGEYVYHGFQPTPKKNDSDFNAMIVSGVDYVCANTFDNKLMLYYRKTKTIKPLVEKFYTSENMAIRGNFLYILNKNNPAKISLLNGINSEIEKCILDSLGRIVFDSGDVVDLDGIQHIGIFKENEASKRSKFCGQDYYIDENNAVIDLSNNRQTQELIEGNSKTYISDGGVLYDWDGDYLIKYEACPSFSITENRIADGKMKFRLQATSCGITKPLDGKAYFRQIKENDLIKLGENAVVFGPLTSDQEKYFEFEIPDGTSVGTKFAFIVESNGLLDTSKSNFDNQPQHLNAYEGIPISLSSQKSIVVIPWEF